MYAVKFVASARRGAGRAAGRGQPKTKTHRGRRSVLFFPNTIRVSSSAGELELRMEGQLLHELLLDATNTKIFAYPTPPYPMRFVAAARRKILTPKPTTSRI